MEQLHKDVLEDAAAPGGFSPVPDFQVVKRKTSQYFSEERGIRERKTRRLVLASTWGGGRIVGFKAAQKTQGCASFCLDIKIPRGIIFNLVLEIPTGKPKSPILCRANSLLLKWV